MAPREAVFTAGNPAVLDTSFKSSGSALPPCEAGGSGDKTCQQVLVMLPPPPHHPGRSPSTPTPPAGLPGQLSPLAPPSSAPPCRRTGEQRRRGKEGAPRLPRIGRSLPSRSGTHAKPPARGPGAAGVGAGVAAQVHREPRPAPHAPRHPPCRSRARRRRARDSGPAAGAVPAPRRCRPVPRPVPAREPPRRQPRRLCSGRRASLPQAVAGGGTGCISPGYIAAPGRRGGVGNAEPAGLPAPHVRGDGEEGKEGTGRRGVEPALHTH